MATYNPDEYMYFDPTLNANSPGSVSVQGGRYPRYRPVSQTGGPSITSADPDKQAQQDRIGAAHAGNALDQDLVDYTNSQSGRAEGYEDRLNEAYDPFLSGGGGYTPEQSAAIQNGGSLDGVTLTQEQIDAQQLTPEEQAAMLGNPEAGMEYFQPDRERATASRGADAQRGAVQQLSGELNSAVSRDHLGLRAGYGEDLMRNAEGTGENVRGILGGDNMEVSDQFLQDYQMTPEEKQGIITSAGMDVRDRYQSQIDDMGRRARAEGTNAVGASAMQERLQRRAAAEGGDAMTRARVQADAEQAKRMAAAEDMRVGYGQRAAGMRSNAELNLGEMAERAVTEPERQRLAAEQFISNRQSANAATAGAARLATERGIADTELDSERRFTDQGIANQRAIDATRTQRAGTVATNRQSISQAGQQVRYGQTANARGVQSGQAQTVADAQRADQREARGHLQAQQTQANQNVTQAQQGRLQNNATTQNAQANATQNMTSARGTPGKGERILGGILGAAGGVGAAFAGGKERGGVITKPTYVLVAESGPEAVVPLGVEPDETEVLPSVALTASQGSFDTSAPPMRGQSAYAQRYRRAG